MREIPFPGRTGDARKGRWRNNLLEKRIQGALILQRTKVNKYTTDLDSVWRTNID